MNSWAGNDYPGIIRAAGCGSGTPLITPDGGQVVAAHADGKLAAVVEVVAKHVHDDPLARAWAEDVALPLRQGIGLLEDVLEVCGGPAGKGLLDHAPCGLQSG